MKMIFFSILEQYLNPFIYIVWHFSCVSLAILSKVVCPQGSSTGPWGVRGEEDVQRWSRRAAPNFWGSWVDFFQIVVVIVVE